MTQAATTDPRGARLLTVAVYALHIFTLLLGFPLLIALAINLFARGSVRGTLYDSHFAWQLVTAQWGLALGVPGFVLFFALAPAAGEPSPYGLVGSLLLLLASFWIVYRVLRGMAFWSNRQPAPLRGKRTAPG